MTSDAYTRPERAAEIRQAKRYRSAMRKAGYCAACVHREKEFVTAFGLNVCGISRERIYEHCQKDSKLPKFQLDDTVLKRFRDAA